MTRTLIAVVLSALSASTAFTQTQFSQAKYSPTPTPTPQGRTRVGQTQIQATPQRTIVPAARVGSAQAPLRATTPVQVQPTPTPVPPPDARAYFERMVASSNDKKFHLTVNGKDLALAPFHVWPQKSTGNGTTSMCVSMRSDDRRVYDIEFLTTGDRVSGVRIARIDGESVRSR